MGLDLASQGADVVGGGRMQSRGGSVSVSQSLFSNYPLSTHPHLSPPVLDCSPILSSFQVILLEHIIMCRLVTGHKATALQEVMMPEATHMGGKAVGVGRVSSCHMGECKFAWCMSAEYPTLSFQYALLVGDPGGHN